MYNTLRCQFRFCLRINIMHSGTIIMSDNIQGYYERGLDIINTTMERCSTQGPSTSSSQGLGGKRPKRSSAYNVTSNSNRKCFLDLVLFQGLSIRAVQLHLLYFSQAANKVGIKYSTAKTIIKVYRTEGRTYKKNGKSDEEKSFKKKFIAQSLIPTLDEQHYFFCETLLKASETAKPPLGNDFWAKQLSIHFADSPI